MCTCVGFDHQMVYTLCIERILLNDHDYTCTSHFLYEHITCMCTMRNFLRRLLCLSVVIHAVFGY